MRKPTFGMNSSLDGHIAAPGADLGWSVPSDELFQWSDMERCTGCSGVGPSPRGSPTRAVRPREDDHDNAFLVANIEQSRI